MVKRMLIACMLVAPFAVCTDWLDDIVASYVKHGAFDRVETLSIIEEYREKDNKKRIELEAAAKLGGESSGFFATMRGGSYKAELALLDSQIAYYKKVASSIIEFTENKKEQESFTSALEKLSRYRKRLEELRSKYRKSSSTFDKMKIGTVLAAKETQLASYKAYVKNILI